jgi:hypothetical protein
MTMVDDVRFDGSELAENGGVRSTSVSITLNAKSLGVDAFVKVEQTYEFVELADANAAIIKRAELAESLSAEALEIIADTAKRVRAELAKTPQGSVQTVAATQPVAPPGVQAGQTVSGQGQADIRAVANGASHSQEWLSVPSKFGDGELRFLSTASYSSQDLEGEVGRWLQSKGLNPAAFVVWDNRPGPRGLEAGVPQGSVANVKIDKALLGSVPDDFARVPAARVKFNSNGSLYVWFTKEFEGYAKYSLAPELKA